VFGELPDEIGCSRAERPLTEGGGGGHRLDLLSLMENHAFVEKHLQNSSNVVAIIDAAVMASLERHSQVPQHCIDASRQAPTEHLCKDPFDIAPLRQIGWNRYP